MSSTPCADFDELINIPVSDGKKTVFDLLPIVVHEKDCKQTNNGDKDDDVGTWTDDSQKMNKSMTKMLMLKKLTLKKLTIKKVDDEKIDGKIIEKS